MAASTLPDHPDTVALWSAMEAGDSDPWYESRGLAPAFLCRDPDPALIPTADLRDDWATIAPLLARGVDGLVAALATPAYADVALRAHVVRSTGTNYQYAHYSPHAAATLGNDWTGRTVLDVASRTPFASLFWCLYRIAETSGQPVYAENLSIPGLASNFWLRLVLPVRGVDGGVEGLVNFSTYYPGVQTWGPVLPREPTPLARAEATARHATLKAAMLERQLSATEHTIDDVIQSGPVAIALIHQHSLAVRSSNYLMRELLSDIKNPRAEPANALFDNPDLLAEMIAELGDPARQSVVRDARLSLPSRRSAVEVTLARTRVGGPASLALWVIDISERIRLQSELQSALANAEALNQQKNRMFSIVAHDLNNAFHGLIGWSEVLAKTARRDDPAGIAKAADEIVHAASLTQSLVSNLLTWARNQLEGTALNWQAYPLAGLARESLQTLRPPAAAKDITIVEANLDIAVRADRGVVTTVLRNLVGNAVKFTPKGGEIRLSGEARGDRVVVSVSDTGLGMTPEQVRQLFGTGAPIRGVGTAGETGAGLGLSLCRQFLEQMGSTLSIASTPGAGSRFSFDLPSVQ